MRRAIGLRTYARQSAYCSAWLHGLCFCSQAPRMLRMEAPPANNQTCQDCSRDPAQYFCTCSYPHTTLCPKCISEHHSKSPGTVHFIVPLYALDSIETYMQKFAQINSVKAAMRKRIESIDQTVLEILKAFDDVIASIQRYKDQIVRKIASDKEELKVAIQSAIKEAEDYLQNKKDPSSPLACAFMTQPSERLQFFHYSISVPNLDSLLGSWFTYRFCLEDVCNLDRGLPASKHLFSYLAQPLVYVEPTQLKIFDLSKECWDPFPLSKHIVADDGSRYIWTDSGLFCSGSTH